MVFGRLFCINFMYTCEEKYYIHSSEGQVKDKKYIVPAGAARAHYRCVRWVCQT